MPLRSKDWVGNKNSVYKTLGASSHTEEVREANDYYATDPKAGHSLMLIEKFHENIWECACGEGHLSKVFEVYGHNVFSSDLIYRGYGDGVIDFLKENNTFDGDIITNPPYKFALEFILKSLQTISTGRKVAMFLKLQFLEGKARKEFFTKNPPKVVHISSGRIECAMNGKFKGESAVSYAWFIWEKGYTGQTIIKWF